jgi:hypothetical protein
MASNYVYQPYPKMIYRDGAYKVVNSEEERDSAFLEGWGAHPEHKRPEPEQVRLPESESESRSPHMIVNFLNKRGPGRPRKVQ